MSPNAWGRVFASESLQITVPQLFSWCNKRHCIYSTIASRVLSSRLCPGLILAAFLWAFPHPGLRGPYGARALWCGCPDSSPRGNVSNYFS